MDNDSHRTSKRIVLDSDEEEEQVNSQQEAEIVEKPKPNGLGELFDADDYEELDEKEEAPREYSDNEENAGLFGDDDGEENEGENEDGYDFYDQDQGQEQEMEIEQREMDLVIPRYPPSHKPSEDVSDCLDELRSC